MFRSPLGFGTLEPDLALLVGGVSSPRVRFGSGELCAAESLHRSAISQNLALCAEQFKALTVKKQLERFAHENRAGEGAGEVFKLEPERRARGLGGYLKAQEYRETSLTLAKETGSLRYEASAFYDYAVTLTELSDYAGA